MRILIIEDNVELCQTLQRAFSDESFVSDIAHDGEAGSYTARTNKYDLIVLDYLLPKRNGDQVCRELRKAGVQTPIMIMSVRTELGDKVTLLQDGADDYICKPFSVTELMARARALLRRPYRLESRVLTLDDLTVDMAAQEVSVSGERVYLTKKEYMLVECMAQRSGQVVTRSVIVESVWDNAANPFSNTVEAHIRNVRKKIEKPTGKRYIHTVPGRGYKLDRVR